jgi:hypothetical protein
MPKPKKAKEEIEEIEDETEEIEEQEEIKSPKILDLLSAYRETDLDYTAIVYKRINGKRVLCTKYYNELPDEVNDLQNKFKGGVFVIYIKDTNSGKLLGSAEVNILEIDSPIVNQNSENKSGSKKELLEELSMLAGIIKGENSGGDNKQMMLEILKLQNQMSEKLMNAQRESEKNMMSLIMQIQNKKTDLSDMLEIFTTLDDLRGGKENTSMVEKVLTSPMVQPFIEKAAAGILSGTPAAPPPALPEPVKRTVSIEEYAKDFPKELIDKITEENAEKMAMQLYKNNKNALDYETAINIILFILKNKKEGTADESK